MENTQEKIQSICEREVCFKRLGSLEIQLPPRIPPDSERVKVTADFISKLTNFRGGGLH